MTAYEVLKICGGVIETLEKAGVKPSDHKFVALFEDFQKAKQRGEKISYVVGCLARQYNMSERSVYGVVKRLGNDCKPSAP